MSGRPGPLSRRTAASPLTPTKRTSPSAPAASGLRTFIAGGLEMAPRPPTLGRAPAEPWRASEAPRGVSRPAESLGQLRRRHRGGAALHDDDAAGHVGQRG